MSVCAYVHVNAGAEEAERSIWVPLKLELQAVVSCPAWVLETKLMSFERAVSPLKHSAISLTPNFLRDG